MSLEGARERKCGQAIGGSREPQRPPGWTYQSFTWTTADGDFEAWVQKLHDDGWERWSGSGTWAQINNAKTFVISLRSWVEKPWATPPR